MDTQNPEEETRMPGIDKRARTVAVIMVLVAVVAVGAAWATWNFRPKPQPDVDLVNKYLNGFKAGNLEAVRTSVSTDMLGTLPGTNDTFKSQVKNSPNGQIQAWEVTKVDRNEFIGQSIIDVTVRSTVRTYALEFDVLGLPEGLKIRAVRDANSPAPAPASSSGHQGIQMPPTGMGTGGMGTGGSSGSDLPAGH
jgi:hypothetical protein